MDYTKLKAAAAAITMPEEMKHRIVRNCKTQISDLRKETAVKTRKNTAFFKKPAVIFAALAICLSLSVGALAQTDVLQGFFKDIINGRGAVTGTAYEQASEEIGMSAAVNGDTLTVQAVFSDPQAAPYRDAERLGIEEYRITDASGKCVKAGAAEGVTVVDGQAAITVRLDDIADGSYTLLVTAFVSEKKADQPLKISGSWECAFTK